MNRLAILSLLALPSFAFAELVAWFPMNHSGKDVVRGTQGELKGDAVFENFSRHGGVNFGGKNGVFFVPDSQQFAFGSSFSMSVKVWVKALPQGGTSPAGQIVFRGDDRPGLDSYTLNLGNDGYYYFGLYGPNNQASSVRAKSKLKTWQTLLGAFDFERKILELSIDGRVVAEQFVPFVPIVEMDGGASPGFSIGNVQNPFGGYHNQPFNGVICDVRLFNSVATWRDVTRDPRVVLKQVQGREKTKSPFED